MSGATWKLPGEFGEFAIEGIAATAAARLKKQLRRIRGFGGCCPAVDSFHGSLRTSAAIEWALVALGTGWGLANPSNPAALIGTQGARAARTNSSRGFRFPAQWILPDGRWSSQAAEGLHGAESSCHPLRSCTGLRAPGIACAFSQGMSECSRGQLCNMYVCS